MANKFFKNAKPQGGPAHIGKAMEPAVDEHWVWRNDNPRAVEAPKALGGWWMAHTSRSLPESLAAEAEKLGLTRVRATQ